MPRITEPCHKVCPKCQPHLAPKAGASSGMQAVPREPSFTRRKKSVGHDKQVTFTTEYTENGVSTPAEENAAMRFKAGFRRASNSAHPSTYQLNYHGWNDSRSSVPLLEAEKQLHSRSRASSKPTQPERPEKTVVVSSKHGGQERHNDHCVHMVPDSRAPALALDDVENLQPGTHGKDVRPVTVGPGRNQRNLVEPLALPVSADNARNGDGKVPAEREPVRTREPQLSAPDERKQSRQTHTNVAQEQEHTSSSTGVGAVRRKKKRGSYSSPLKRLYKSDYQQRHALNKGMFQTQYQTHYKDWGGDRKSVTNGAPGTRAEPPARRYGSLPARTNPHNPPVLRSGSLPAARTDPSDPRLLKHLPHPHHPHCTPEAHWKTNYDMNYVEPQNYKYEKGAWRSSGSGQQDVDTEDTVSWVDQVLELRDQADHYKWKTQRTNFNINDMLTHEPSESGCASRAPGPDPRSGRGECAQNYAEPLLIEDIEDDDSDSVAELAAGHVDACRGSPPMKAAPYDQDQGRVPTPDLKLSDSRHHLDRTTPDSGILIPLTQSPPPSPKFRRDVRSSVPNRPPPDGGVISRHGRSPSAGVQVQQQSIRSPRCHSVPNHTHPSAEVSGEICRRSRSPSAGPKVQENVRCHSIPNHTEVSGKTCRHSRSPSAGAKMQRNVPRHSIPNHTRASADVSTDRPTSSSPVRRLNFERHIRSKSISPHKPITPPKRSRSNHKPLSCHSCGMCLQPSASAVIGRSNSRPQVEIVKSQPASQQKIRQDLHGHTTEKSRVGAMYHTADRTGSSDHPGSAQRRSTYKARDVDEVSLSSSCSIASEVLERAKNRRNHFWTSSRVNTSSLHT